MAGRPIVAFFVGIVLASTASADGGFVIHAGWEHELLALGHPYVLGAKLPDGSHWVDLEIQPTELLFRIAVPGDTARITLRAQPAPGLTPSVRFVVEPPAQAQAAGVAALRGAIEKNASDSLWQRVQQDAVSGAPQPPSSSLLQLPNQGPWNASVGVLIAAGIVALLLRRRFGRMAGVTSVILFAGATGVLVIGAMRVQRAIAVSDWSALGLAEGGFIRWTIVAAAALLLAAFIDSVRGLRREVGSLSLALDTVVVGAVTAIVRLGFTQPNVLSEGGIAYTRLLGAPHAYAGLSTLIRMVFSDPTLDQAMWVTRGLGLIAPVLVLLLARLLDLSRGAALLAGLLLACWPLGSVLASSDLEMPALATLGLAGLLLLELGRRRAEALAFAAGAALLAFHVWGRPEGLVICLPAAIVWLGMSREMRRSPVVLAALVWLAGSVTLRCWNLVTWPSTESLHVSGGPWTKLPWSSYVANLAILPFWLWLSAPVGMATLRGHPLRLVIGAIVASLLPLHVLPPPFDPSGSFLEAFSYASALFPWLAIASGVGWATLARVVSRQRRAPQSAVLGAVVLLALGSIWRERAYLARDYGFTSERRALVAALGGIPAGCGVVLPEDGSGGSTNEFYKRYRSWLPPTVPSLGTQAFLRQAGQGSLPSLPGAGSCWYMYRGAYCYLHLEPELDGVAKVCADVLRWSDPATAHLFPTEYRSHRQATLVAAKPEQLSLGLFRLNPR